MHIPFGNYPAPREPDFGRPAPAAPWPPAAPPVALPGVAPPPERPVPAAPPLPRLPEGPRLAELAALRKRGAARQALAGLRQLAAAPLPARAGSFQLAESLAASHRAAELALELEQDDVFHSQVQEFVTGWFAQAPWQARRKDAVAHLLRAARLELALERYDEALELFEQALPLGADDADLRRELALAAARIGRAELSTAPLLLDVLAEGGLDADQERALGDCLRSALRIGLAAPDEEHLPRAVQLNERMIALRPAPWAAANLALAAWRRGDPERADLLRLGVGDRAACDGPARLALAIVAYGARAWGDAAQLLLEAEQSPDAPPLVPFYRSLTRLCQLLGGLNLPLAAEAFAAELAAEAARAQTLRPEGGPALDAAWVLGAAWARLGRDREALAEFDAAPLEQASWRALVWEAEARARQLDLPRLEERLGQVAARGQGAVAALVRAGLALARLDFEAAHALEAAAQAAPGGRDPDLPVARACIAWAWRLSRPRLAELPPPPEELAQSGAEAELWWERLTALCHLARHELEPADAILAAPRQAAAPAREIDLLRALRFALAGTNEDAAERIFEHQAQLPWAGPAERLRWALCLAGRQRHAELLPLLVRLVEELPAAIEVRLLRLEVEAVRALGLAALPREAESFADTVTDWTSEALWMSAPRAALYRPWQRLVGAGLWSFPATPDMHRIGDMLHAAVLLLAADRPREADELLALVERLLGDDRQVLRDEFGRVFRRAAEADLAAGRFVAACRHHARAESYDNREPAFVERLAAALAGWETTPPDEVLETLTAWAGAAWGSESDILAQAPGRALAQALRIEGHAPAEPADLARRAAWLARLDAARPGWAFVARSRAWAALRNERWQEVLAALPPAGEAAPEDRVEVEVLRGRALWRLARFPDAARAFQIAVEASGGVAEIEARWALAEVAGLAAGGEFPLAVSDERTRLIALADPVNLPAEERAEAALWRGAFWLAAGRAQEAAAELAPRAGPAAEQESARQQLLALALAMADQWPEALESSWPAAGTGELPRAVLALGALLLAIAPRWQWRRQAAARLDELRRRGADEPAYLLALAELALLRGAAEPAREPLAALAGAGPALPVLTPLAHWLRAMLALVTERLALLGGEATAPDVPAAVRLFPELHREQRRLEAARARAAGDREAAHHGLESLASAGPPALAAKADLALLLARGGEPARARTLAEQVLADDPQPAALLALAELEEASRTPAAEAAWQRLEAATMETGGRLFALAALALAGGAEARGDNAEAERRLSAAVVAAPELAEARRRLAIFTARHGGDEAARRTALAWLWPEGAPPPEDLPSLLIAAQLARDLAAGPREATLLAAAARSPSLAALPSADRRAVLRWNLAAQLAQGQFEAAVAAIEALDPASDPALAAQLDLCRAWQGRTALRRAKLSAAELARLHREMARMATERPEEPLPRLLGALAAAGCGDASTAREHAAALAALVRRNGSPLEQLAGLLAEPAAAAEPLAKLVGEKAITPQAAEAWALVLASLAGDEAQLAERGRAILASDPIPAAAALPIAADALVVLAALADLASGDRGAEARLKAWAARPEAGPESRRLYAQLLAPRIVAALRGQHVQLAWELTNEALPHADFAAHGTGG